MRTYSRKRPEYKQLENVTELCRLCLEKYDEGVPIYTDDDSVLYSPLALRVMVCVGVELAKEDSLSNHICTECHEELKRCYSFRKKCEVSYLKLKCHMQAVKAKEFREKNNDSSCSESKDSVYSQQSSKDSDYLPQSSKDSDCSQQSLKDSVDSQQSTKDKDSDDEPLSRLAKILKDEGRISNSKVLEILSKTNENNNTSVQNTLLNNIVPVIARPIRVEDALYKPEPPNLISAAIPSQSEVKEVFLQEEEATPSDPDLAEFLSTMLTDLGVLTQHEDGVVTLDPNMCRTLELETKDGNNITFELVEEHAEEIVVMDIPQQSPAESMSTSICEMSDETYSPKRSIAGRRSCKCPQCGRTFAARSVLARHVRNVHARARPHECPACGRCFAQKEVMKRHQLIHKDQRPFPCDKCPKSFTQRASLDAHKLKHRPERSLTLHPCPHCSKIFFYASGLSRHLIRHTNKKIECFECKRTFSDRSSLRRHEKTTKHITDSFEMEVIASIKASHSLEPASVDTNSTAVEAVTVDTNTTAVTPVTG